MSMGAQETDALLARILRTSSLYEILNVGAAVDAEELKKSYRKVY